VDEMISILLAEAVLDQNSRISTVQDSGNDVTFYGKESEFLGTYNIYELAHKCKEWGKQEGFQISSCIPIVADEDGYQIFHKNYQAYIFIFTGKDESPRQVLFPSFIGGIEPEAIFKACQWILDNE